MDSIVDILNAFGRGQHQYCAYREVDSYLRDAMLA